MGSGSWDDLFDWGVCTDTFQEYQGKVFDMDPEDAKIVPELRAICSSLEEIGWDTIGEEVVRLPTGAEDLNIHAQIYHLADKYFIKGLKERVCEKFAECLDDSFAGSTIYGAVEVIFTTTPETDTGLRNLAIKRISEEKTKFSFEANPCLASALKEIPGLAYGLLEHEDKLRQQRQKAAQT
jgi:hypothetical protein